MATTIVQSQNNTLLTDALEIEAAIANEKTQSFAKESRNDSFPKPGLTKWVWDTILVKPAYIQQTELVPPVYDSISEQIMVKPSIHNVTIRPATFDTVTEQVLVKPASGIWVNKNNTTLSQGEIPDSSDLVWKIIPAEYKSVKKRVLKTPTSGPAPIPPVYETVFKKIIKTPAIYVEKEIPAEYIIIQRRIDISSAYKGMQAQALISQMNSKVINTRILIDSIPKTNETNSESKNWICMNYSTSNNIENLIKTCYDCPNPKEDCRIWIQEILVQGEYEQVTELIQTKGTRHYIGEKPNNSKENLINAPIKQDTVTKNVLRKPPVYKWVQREICKEETLDCLLKNKSSSYKPKNIMAWINMPTKFQKEKTLGEPSKLHPSNHHRNNSFPFIEISPNIQDSIYKETQPATILCEIQIPIEEVAPIYAGLQQIVLGIKEPKGFTKFLSSNSEKSTLLTWEATSDKTRDGKWVIKYMEGPCNLLNR